MLTSARSAGSPSFVRGVAVRGSLSWALAVLFLVPASGSAQAPSLRDLALRVNVGDRVEVEDATGAMFRGRLRGLTSDEIVVETASGTRRFGPDVRSVAVDRRPLRTAVLVGAGAGAAAGLVAGCTGDEREECADAGLVLGAAGAGAGALVGALRPRRVVAYVRGRVTAGGESAGSPGPLDALALRVNLGDRLRVRDRSGATIDGRLTHLTGTELTIETGSGVRRVTAADVRSVAVRRYPLGYGALVGAGVFTALAYAASGCRENSDCVPLAAASLGAGIGTAVGALVPRMRGVFRAEDAVTIGPAIGRRHIGLMATVRW